MFSFIDWAILAAYMAAVLWIGVRAGKQKEHGDDFFLAGRSMPTWAVSVSVLATALSAATFIGGPQQSYRGDLTYLATNIGGLLAVLIVGFIFLPAFYAAGTPSIYGYLGQRFNVGTQAAAGGMFMLGRLLASGARLFITAIPFALIAFGSAEGWPLVMAILLVTVAAAAYTMLGGIRAVIWTDVLQACVVVGTVTLAVFVLFNQIDLPIGEIVDRLTAADSGDKLTVIDWSVDPSKSYTAWASLIGFTLFMVAAFGTDQDLAQRMLTCKTPQKATWAVILSNLIGWPVVLLFLVVGLLLWVEEQVHGPILPDLPDQGDRAVFLRFILRDMPVGLRGLMVAGLFAAAMSSLDSVLNALASSTVADWLRPLQARRGKPPRTATEETRLTRFIIAVWAMLLACFAIGAAMWQSASGETLITFALGVMVFAYAGLLGVFATALLTKRGSPASAAAALLVGLLIVLAIDPSVWPLWIGDDIAPLAFPWRMTVASVIAFCVCVAGRPLPSQTKKRR
jgi:SSS family solute:Na+ symporter